MTLETFKDHLETYGANLSRWPKESCALATDLIERSKEAKAALADMQTFESRLEGSNESLPPADLLDKIIKKAHSD
jgi:hypothetical protein